MTAAPIDIPLDDRGAPDLQLLVRKLGEAAAKARGEAYDPAHNPAHAGYPRITPAIWQAFDAAMAEYQRACRAGLASAAPSNAGTRRRPPSAEFADCRERDYAPAPTKPPWTRTQARPDQGAGCRRADRGDRRDPEFDRRPHDLPQAQQARARPSRRQPRRFQMTDNPSSHQPPTGHATQEKQR